MGGALLRHIHVITSSRQSGRELLRRQTDALWDTVNAIEHSLVASYSVALDSIGQRYQPTKGNRQFLLLGRWDAHLVLDCGFNHSERSAGVAAMPLPRHRAGDRA